MTFASLVALLLLLASSASSASDPVGLWWAEGGAAQVEIRRCGQELCGTVVWLRSPLDENGCALLDAHNPEARLRGRELIGIELVRGLRPDPGRPGVWSRGSVYDPTSGRSYSAELRLAGPDRLHLRGYLGVRLLGRTTTWIRVRSELQCLDPA